MRPQPPEVTPPTRVAYAKNAEHERFLLKVRGTLPGRYHLAYLVGIEYMGRGRRARADRA